MSFDIDNSNNVQEMKKRSDPKTGRNFLFIGVLIISLFLLFNSAFILKPNEYAVIRQFGKIVKVADSEGLKFKVPLVQSKSIVPKNILFYDVPPAEINTLDKKRIVVDYYSLWEITDPVMMIETLRTIEGAESRLSDIIYSNVRNELGKLDYGSIINPDDNDRGGFDKLVQEDVNKLLTANKNGIQIVDIQIKRIDLPESNEKSVYSRMISERETKAQEYLSQGNAEAKKITANVDREAQEIIARANSKAESIIAKGEGEAAKIYNNVYGQDAEFFKLYTTLESYKTTIDEETVIMLPVDSPYLKYLKGN